jgi:hypothetical protein
MEAVQTNANRLEAAAAIAARLRFTRNETKLALLRSWPRSARSLHFR